MTAEEAKFLGVMLGVILSIIISSIIALLIFIVNKKKRKVEGNTFYEESYFSRPHEEDDVSVNWYDLYRDLLFTPSYKIVNHLIDLKAISANCADIPCEDGSDWYVSFDKCKNYSDILPHKFDYKEYTGILKLGGLIKGRYNEPCYDLILKLFQKDIEKIRVKIFDFDTSQRGENNDIEVSFIFPELGKKEYCTFQMDNIPESLIRKVSDILGNIEIELEKKSISFKLKEDKINKSKKKYEKNYIKSL